MPPRSGPTRPDRRPKPRPPAPTARNRHADCHGTAPATPARYHPFPRELPRSRARHSPMTASRAAPQTDADHARSGHSSAATIRSSWPTRRWVAPSTPAQPGKRPMNSSIRSSLGCRCPTRSPPRPANPRPAAPSAPSSKADASSPRPSARRARISGPIPPPVMLDQIQIRGRDAGHAWPDRPAESPLQAAVRAHGFPSRLSSACCNPPAAVDQGIYRFW